MIIFLNNYFYMITFFIVIFLFIVVSLTKARSFVIANSKMIALILGLGQFIAFWTFMIFNFANLRWASSMLQDLCPLGQFISIIAFIWNKEKIYKGLMPWLIIGASVTMLGSSVKIFTYSWKLITYSQHTIMLIQGLFILLIISPYTKEELIKLLIFPICLILWNFVVGFIPWQVTNDPNWVTSSTALFPPALAPGTVYYVLRQIFPIPYPLPTIIFYIFALIIAYAFALSVKYGPIFYKKVKLFCKKNFLKIKKLRKKQKKF